MFVLSSNMLYGTYRIMVCKTNYAQLTVFFNTSLVIFYTHTSIFNVTLFTVSLI
jgi:hypothetical protein